MPRDVCEIFNNDPIGIAGGLNTFGYAEQNPVNLTDPNGTCVACLMAAAWLEANAAWAIPAATGAVEGVLGYYSGSMMSVTPSAVGKISVAIEETTGILKTEVNVAGGVCRLEKVLPENKSQLWHIFSNGLGHLADTAEGRQLLLDVANDAQSILGPDKWGNMWFAKVLSTGEQIWVQTRNNIIINGGLNKIPKTFSPETGLSAITKP